MALSDYHLFAIDCSVSESSEGISFSELENDLGDSFYDQALFGSETGNRRWLLKLRTLSGGSMDANTVTGINGETLTREAYLWDLFSETKVTGAPFAVKSKRNGNYYLVRFADRELVYERFLTKLYSTGIELKQYRGDGETCFSAGELEQTWAAYDPESFPGGFGLAWPDESLNGNNLANVNGDVVAGTSGTLPIVRFSVTTNDGWLDSALTVLAKDIFLLMKMREATFSNFAGVLSADTGSVALLGDTGETTFFDLGFGVNYQYRLNGVVYAENNQQAPMNAWGAVHLRHTAGIPLTNLQMGKDRGNAGRYAEMDVAYVIISDSLFPKSTVREIDEFLAVLRSQLA